MYTWPLICDGVSKLDCMLSFTYFVCRQFNRAVNNQTLSNINKGVLILAFIMSLATVSIRLCYLLLSFMLCFKRLLISVSLNTLILINYCNLQLRHHPPNHATVSNITIGIQLSSLAISTLILILNSPRLNRCVCIHCNKNR